MLAQKKKEKMMAKKQQQADTRNKRMAFKEQLEAQSPKVYVEFSVIKSNRNLLQNHVFFVFLFFIYLLDQAVYWNPAHTYSTEND